MYTFLLSKIEVGSHLYINFTDSLHLHGETVIVSSIVVAAVTLFLVLGTNNLQRIPGPLQSIVEIVYELVKSIAITQMGPSYYAQFLPFVATVFLFVLGSSSSSPAHASRYAPCGAPSHSEKVRGPSPEDGTACEGAARSSRTDVVAHSSRSR